MTRYLVRALGAGVVALAVGGQSAGHRPQDKFKAVTTFTVIADMAQNVAGDAAIVESITKPGAEIHNYQPTPGDILRAQDADLILWNGLNLELWFEKFFQNLSDVPERRCFGRRSSRWASPRGPIPASPTRMPGCRPTPR